LTLIGRQRIADAVSLRGLILRHGDAESVTHPKMVTSAEHAGVHDLVILCVRSYDVEASVADARVLTGDHGVLLAMQNGVGSEEILAGAFGRERVVAGTLTARTAMEEPGIVTRCSRADGVALSSMDGSVCPAWIAGLFQLVGMPTVQIACYRSLRWSKLLLNMLGAASSAILDVDMSALVADRLAFRIEQLAFREATRVMSRQHIKAVALPGYPVPLVRMTMRLPRPLAQRSLGPRLAGARGAASPAMRADVTHGRSEVAWLNGAVVDAARAARRTAPVNAALTALVEDLTRNPRLRQKYARRPDRLASFVRQYERYDARVSDPVSPFPLP